MANKSKPVKKRMRKNAYNKRKAIRNKATAISIIAEKNHCSLIAAAQILTERTTTTVRVPSFRRTTGAPEYVNTLKTT